MDILASIRSNKHTPLHPVTHTFPSACRPVSLEIRTTERTPATMRNRFLPVLCLMPALALHAQVANNTALVGTITDSAGNVLTGVKVTAVNEATKVAYPGTTNGEGYYSIQFVEPGTYTVSVEQPGFSSVSTRGVIVELNSSARTDVALPVGSVATEMNVTASTPALSTDDALLGATIDKTEVKNLPLNGRHAMDLAATASNVIIGPKTSFTGNPPGEDFIGAGTREVTNSLTLDGITIMNSLISTSPVSPNPDALSAVQVQTGNYTAQYGAYMGVHINMDTLSGTNALHGTAYDYVQNTALDAKSWLSLPTAATPVLHYNQFGGVVSGPVFLPHLYNGRDRTFFMGSYEGLRQVSQSTTIATFMTAAERNGDYSALSKQLVNPATGIAYAKNQVTNISPIATKLISYMPLPNLPGDINNYNATVPINIQQNQTLDRVDENIGDRVRLFGRYSWQRLFYLSGSVTPTSNAYSPTTDSNSAFGYTQIITPNFINDFRFGYNKLSTDVLSYFGANNIQGTTTNLGIPGFTDLGNPGLPDINITSYQGVGADGTNWYQDDRTLHGYDQISYTRGPHNIMAGADIRKMDIGRAAQNTPRGAFTFTGNYSGDASADFLTGYAQTVVTPITQIKGSVAEWRDGFFVEDNWQVSHKLTLLYGLRYELPTVPYSLNGYARIINQSYTALIPATTAASGATYTPDPGFKFIGPNHNLWAPRLGIAYRVTDKIVVRGGGGIFYNPNHLNAFTLATGNYPLANSFTYSGAPSGIGSLTFTNPTGTGAPTTSCVPGTLGCYTTAFTDNYYLPTPRMYQWNLDTGLELWHNAAFELQYLGSKAIDLDRSYYPNQPLPGAGAVNPRRPLQNFGQIRQIQNDSFSTYNGFNVILRQRLTHGLDANVNYTWAKNLDTSSDANGGGTAMIQYDLRADYGRSNWDIRNRFVASIDYSLPALTRLNPLLRSALGGWQANTIINIQSGLPFNVSISNDRANVGGIGTQRPSYVHAGSNDCSRATRTVYANATSCIDTSAYTLPALYTFGNVHRNDQAGPGYVNTNLSLFKNFPVFERLTAQFRAEAFNVFNHPSPSNPNTTLGVGTLNANTGLTSFAANNFGTVTSTQSTARILQLAGKINF